MTDVQWRGVFPALTTKFTASDEIDWTAMERHLEFQLDAGVHGLVILGSLGETSTLRHAEKLEMVKFFSRMDRKGRPLIACIAEASTRDAKELPLQRNKRVRMDSCCFRQCVIPVTVAKR